jgi:membrane-associated phospholipid phosphatase
MTTQERDEAPPGRTAPKLQAARPRHGPVAQLLIAWSPLSTVLLAYAAASWVTAPLRDGAGGGVNRFGFALHVTGPAHVDQALFGVLPSAWLQARLVDGSPHWYDAAAAVIYVTHVVSLPVATAIVWFRLRALFAAWVAAVLTLTMLGIAGYVVYPAAPPWLAAAHGRIDGRLDTVHRISAGGWGYLHLDAIGRLTTWGQAGSNPVAAMPSLHAGVALMLALFFWPVAGRWWRAALLLYAAAMAVTLVYTGEHYVVDVLVGWVLAGLAASLGSASSRSIQRPMTSTT